ncbi:hypothetical protein [Brevibacterium casei]|uniref:PH domain-containing protein n=1 Tax=Brevibacterium casei TaxID=33889 RepID=A0A269ZDN9_9MICO|nr:hypothetical protein [Brevibacterium casei]MCT1551217.1 hypothetical protein [Brevibacterium casei]MCT1560148.1 hypothetical protein [Brevibacterium casei]MCT2208961.1 hypothetical protein [Brevibacterium casei]MCT2359041.1 hypothetical protein [Brevibacterium casei]PAK95894.1 hypothetical protein B8X04_06450 [Brevibacterium casei]
MANSEIGPDETRIVRTTGSTVLFVLVAAVAAIGIGSIVVGDFTLRGLAVAGIPVLLFVGVWALYRHPRVELRTQEIVLVNPLTTITVPWNLVDGFDTHFGLSVRTHEKSYSSWPLAGRGKKMEKDAHGIRRLVDEPSPAVDTVLDHHARLNEAQLANPRGERTITQVWNVPVIAALAVAIVWAILGFMAVPRW